MTKTLASESAMSDDAVCTYQIQFPKQAGQYDYLSITVIAHRNTDVAIVVAEKRTSCKYKEVLKVVEGQEVNATYPFSVFVVVRATKNNANFALTYKYVD